VALSELAYSFAPALYPDVVNDLLAVKIAPSVRHAHDTPPAYEVGKGAFTLLLNIRYPDRVGPTSLPHHASQGPRLLERLDWWQALIAISCLTRDRLFSDCYARLTHAATRSAEDAET
jgi:hypothetical protein